MDAHKEAERNEAPNLEVDLQAISEDDEDVVEVEVEDSKGATSTRLGKRKRNKTSEVWNFFDDLPLGADNKQRSKCKQCGAIYLSASRYGTGNMKKHIEKCVRRDTRDIGQLFLSQSSRSMSMRSSKFDPEKFRELVTAAIILHDLPFQFVEYEGIRAIFKYLCEEVNLVSRNTSKSDVLKMYKREKARLQHMLNAAPGRISLTSDLWTSITTDGYLCLTAHFIDEEWKLQKRILNFCFMPPPHNGVCLTEKIYTLLTEWGIEKKLFSMTLDNASSNDSFVEMLKCQLNLNDALLRGGDYFHVRCCAHILNLIVQDGLKEIDEAVVKVRESIKYVRGSQVRKQKFLECATLVSLNPKKGLRQDVPTRWNATFLMLQSAIFYRRAFCHLELSDSNFKHCPSQEEWGRIEKIYRFLEIFYDVTCIFSGNKYPTSNLYFHSVFMVELTLKQEMESPDSFMRRMATQMYVKFSKYWSEFSLILAIAVILDPRYKIQFVEFSYRKLYGNGSIESARVREKLFALFNEYMLKFPTTSTSSEKGSGSVAHEHGTSIGRESRDIMKEFDDFENEEFIGVQKTQLEMYLDEPRVDRNKKLDILSFWKANQFRYPELSSMARDILSIPISTVASESAFSVGGRVLDQYRSALKPDNVEALICTRDWLFGVIGDAQLSLDELTEDIINLNINNDEPSSAQCSNAVEVDA